MLSTVDLLVLTSLVAAFDIVHIIKTSQPNEEVNCTEPFTSVSVPWLKTQPKQPGTIFTTLYFLHDLGTYPIS